MAIFLIDKPKGISSFDVIRILRKRFRDCEIEYKKGNGKPRAPKMGHAGTLDPRATGLMIIASEQDTKKLSTLLGLSKVYEASIMLGVKTDSGDLEGEVIDEKDVSEINEEKIKKVLKEMTGDIQLPVPIYSAIKKNGKPLYKYARQGLEVEVPVKTMHVVRSELKSIRDISAKHPIIDIEIEVKSGTYIRSLAEEFARHLDTLGTLSDLRRTSIGEYKIINAHSADTIPKEFLLN